MRPVSPAFLGALRGSHRIAVEVIVVTGGFVIGTDPPGMPLDIISGDVQLDANAEIRSTLDLTVEGTQKFPLRASDLLAPYGTEVFVRRGIDLGGGNVEFVSLGYHRVETLEQDNAPDDPIRVSAKDRMVGIIEARLVAPQQFTSGTTLGTIITNLVTEVYPDAVIEWDDDSDQSTLARNLVTEQDRYGFLRELVESVGKVFYWDHRGVLVVRDVPDPTDPQFAVDAGPSGVLVQLSRRLTREGVHNAVVASGEAADTIAPPRFVAVDNNPDSPTYWFGRFGKVPRFFTSPFLTTAAQAQSAAESLLKRELGLPYNVDLTSVPNPALEPNDSVSVSYPSRSRSTDRRVETHILERITVPLTAAGAMPATTREQTLVILGAG